MCISSAHDRGLRSSASSGPRNQQINHSIIFSSDADSSMSSVGCLRNQWCFNKSLALGRLISFLLRHKLTNSASSFEKIFSGTLGACDHAMHSQACSAAPQGTAGAPQGCCRGAAGVLQLRWASGAHAEGVHEPGYVCVARYPLADNELGLGLGLGEGWGEGEGTSSSMMSESSRK